MKHVVVVQDQDCVVADVEGPFDSIREAQAFAANQAEKVVEKLGLDRSLVDAEEDGNVVYVQDTSIQGGYLASWTVKTLMGI